MWDLLLSIKYSDWNYFFFLLADVVCCHYKTKSCVPSNATCLTFKAYEYTFTISIIFTKRNNFYDFLFALLEQCSPFKIGSALKGKNLLLREQILFLRVDPNEIGGIMKIKYLLL